MKKILLVFLSLWTFLVDAQNIRKVAIAIPGGAAYEVKAPRNLTSYPLTSTGTASFTAAVSSGAFNLTVISSGCIIAKGTPPPTVAPTCSQTVVAPSWIAGFRYSYDSNHLLTLEGAGDIGTLTFHPVTGGGFPTTNPDGVTINAEQAYSWGQLDNQGIYDKQWKLTYTGTTLQAKATQTGTSTTFTYNITPASGAIRTNLSGTTSTTTTTAPSWLTALQYSHNGSVLTVRAAGVAQMAFNTNPVTSWATVNPGGVTVNSGQFYSPAQITVNNYTGEWQITKAAGPMTITARNSSGETYSVNFSATSGASNVQLIGTTTDPPANTDFARVLIVGNSITDYSTGFGYAASAPEKDYKHLLTAHFVAANANAVVRTLKDFTGGVISDGPYWEAHHFEMDGGLARFNNAAAWQPTTILIRLGENVPNTNNNFAQHYLDLVTLLKSQSPNAKIVVTNSGWSGKDAINSAIQTLSTQNGWLFTDLTNIPNFTTGADNHPNDAGMQTISDKVWSTIVNGTPPPSSGTVDSDGFLVYSDQGWSGADEKQIESSDLVVKFKRSAGATVTYAALKSNNINVVNDHQVNHSHQSNVMNGHGDTEITGTISDKGRQWQLSPYANPAGERPFVVNGHTEYGTGANPVQGGTTEPYSQASPIEKSAVINDPIRGQVFCARIRGLYWNFFYQPGHIPVDVEWWTLPNKTIAYKVRGIVEERVNMPEQRTYRELAQELLCLYNIADFNVHTTRVNGSEYNLRAGIPLGQQGNSFLSDNCVAGTYNGDRSQGVTYYTPQNSMFKSWQIIGESGGWADNASSYINAEVHRNMDIPSRQLDYGYIILGGQTEAMARVSTLPGIDQSFDFDFTSSNVSWWNSDGDMKREGVNGVTFYVGTPNGDNPSLNTTAMGSPHRAWQASAINTIEFTMVVTGASNLNFAWGKPGPNNYNQFTKAIPNIIADGVERTYTVSTSDSNFNGIISWMGIRGVNGTPSNAKIVVRRVRKLNDFGVGGLLLLSLGIGTALRRRKNPGVRTRKPVQSVKSKIRN